MLHGTYSKSNIKQRYTEFMLEDLNHKLYHYWALGHIHQRQELSDMPPIHYSGNIQGRHFGELGTKGCLLVEGDHLHLETTFIPALLLARASRVLVRATFHSGCSARFQTTCFGDMPRGTARPRHTCNIYIQSPATHCSTGIAAQNTQIGTSDVCFSSSRASSC